MYRFSDWLASTRADFFKNFYTHPELLNLSAYMNSVMAAQSGGYDMLAQYDIVDIGEHNPGVTVSWVPLTITTMTYIIGDPYPYQYQIDKDWIFLDCLHDKHVDPTVTLQHTVDFRYDKGVLSFIKYPTIDNFLVSKGLFTSDRLANDIGTAMGYTRRDSYNYRDTFSPISAMFYKGPSIHNIIASANVMVNNPVAKYNDEIVVSAVNGDVITDKYRYNLGGGQLAVNIGDKMDNHQPFADVIEFYTDKITPGWWLNRVPRMFQKYKVDGPIDRDQRDILMDVMLKYFIASVRINLNKTDWRLYKYQPDIWQLILDASPIRTDYILSMYYMATDLDMPFPNYESRKIRTHAFSMWNTKHNINADGWIWTPYAARSVIYPDSTTDVDWFVGSHRFHILNPNSTFNEFWSSAKKQTSYFEPTESNWHGRYVATTAMTMQDTFVSDLDIPSVAHLSHMVVIKAPVDSNIMSVITDPIQYEGFNTILVYGDQNMARNELAEWECTLPTHVGIDGLVTALNTTSTAVSYPTILGGVPKDVKIRINKALAKNTSISLEYGFDKVTWMPLVSNQVIKGAYGNLYFRVTITASNLSSPVFRGLDIIIRKRGVLA